MITALFFAGTDVKNAFQVSVCTCSITVHYTDPQFASSPPPPLPPHLQLLCSKAGIDIEFDYSGEDSESVEESGMINTTSVYIILC